MKVLFICEGNMMRSQMAEAFYNTLSGTKEAFSAGAVATGARRISERAIAVMHEAGIDTENFSSDQLTADMLERADKIIYFPTPYMPNEVKNNPKAEFWDIADPHYNPDKGLGFTRTVRDEIKTRVEKLIENEGR